MYKLNIDSLSQQICMVLRIADNAFIPFDPANTDYQQFKKDIMDGGELQDADGVKMTAKAAKAFIATLP